MTQVHCAFVLVFTSGIDGSARRPWDGISVIMPPFWIRLVVGSDVHFVNRSSLAADADGRGSGRTVHGWRIAFGSVRQDPAAGGYVPVALFSLNRKDVPPGSFARTRLWLIDHICVSRGT